MADLNRIINRAGLVDEFDPWRGDCVSIAVALHNHFGGEYVAISAVAGERYLDHVAIDLDGTAYDGRGRVWWSDLYDTFVHDGTGDIDDHIFHPDEQRVKANVMYSDAVRQEVENLLSVAEDA